MKRIRKESRTLWNLMVWLTKHEPELVKIRNRRLNMEVSLEDCSGNWWQTLYEVRDKKLRYITKEELAIELWKKGVRVSTLNRMLTGKAYVPKRKRETLDLSKV